MCIYIYIPWGSAVLDKNTSSCSEHPIECPLHAHILAQFVSRESVHIFLSGNRVLHMVLPQMAVKIGKTMIKKKEKRAALCQQEWPPGCPPWARRSPEWNCTTPLRRCGNRQRLRIMAPSGRGAIFSTTRFQTNDSLYAC